MAATHNLIEIRPQPGPQEAFLSTPADIAIYGGSAGGGKTYAELIDPLRHINNPGYGAVIFRRTSEQVRISGGLWEEAQKMYPLFGARARELQLDFRFPSGAKIVLDSIQHESDKLGFQGAQICGIYFDELTHFTESQFFYLLSRNRSMCGVRPYVRATTNPDANSWVKRFLAPWLDRGHPLFAQSGEIRYMRRDGGMILWTKEEVPKSKSVTFIRASLFDNKKLMEADPDYLANLEALPLVDRQRLLDGDWDIVEGGNMFRQDWFRIIDHLPEIKRWVRYWDLAATEAKPGKDPDFTVGVLMGLTIDNQVVVADVQRLRETPLSVENRIKLCFKNDPAKTSVRMEQEPGSSGVTVIDHYNRNVLLGKDFKGYKSSGDKTVRAKPYSSHTEKGNTLLMRGSWNQDFINEHVPFPNKQIHDDQVDAASGAFNELVHPKPVLQFF